MYMVYATWMYSCMFVCRGYMYIWCIYLLCVCIYSYVCMVYMCGMCVLCIYMVCMCECLWYMCVCICLYMHTHRCMCSTCICSQVHMWMEARGQCQVFPQLFSTLSQETRFLSEPGVHWLTSMELHAGSSPDPLSLSPLDWNYRHAPPCLAFMKMLRLNSGCHAYIANTLPTESPRQRL